MTAKLKIIARAIIIRINNGEELEDILRSYPALNELEKQELREYINEQNK